MGYSVFGSRKPFYQNVKRVFILVSVILLLGLGSSKYFYDILKWKIRCDVINVAALSQNNNNITATEMIPVFDFVFHMPKELYDRLQIFVPYEKGPPLKFLSKVQWIDLSTNQTVLEFGGRKPRRLEAGKIDQFCTSLVKTGKIKTQIENSKLVSEWVHELAHNKASLSNHEMIISLRSDGVRIISQESTESTRALIIHPNGMFYPLVLQNSAIAERRDDRNFFIQNIMIASDPEGSRLERLKALRKILDRKLSEPTTPIRDLETSLVSMISLQPQDDQAFFNLGKTTAFKPLWDSMNLYLADLNTDPALRLELKTKFNDK